MLVLLNVGINAPAGHLQPVLVAVLIPYKREPAEKNTLCVSGR